MKFRFALLVGLLLITSSTASSSSSSSVATTESGGDGSTSTSSVSTVPAGSSASPASTVSPGSTVSSGPSESPASTVSGATGEPSSAPVTEGGSTVSQGPTTSAPLPNVTVSVLKFGDAVCDDATCTYEIDAPGNNQAVLATDQSIIGADRTQFGGLQANANTKDAAVKKANDDAMAKIQQLQTLLNQIQGNLNSIQNATKIIQAQQNDALGTLVYVEKFITKLNGEPSDCLYQRCLKPTTPAPPTTPTTPAPTTPPSPCLNYACPDDVTGATYCRVDNSTNKAFCTNCIGDFDGYSHCDTVACSASGTAFVPSSAGNATWYSSGYNSTSPVNSTVPAGSNCVYNLQGKFKTDATFSLLCLQSGKVTITFKSADGGFSQDIAATSNLRSLNNVLSKAENGTITLKSTTADPTFCAIPLTKAAASSADWEDGQEVEKKNGFFSWLMGY